MKKDFDYKPFGLWEVYPDPKADYIQPRWWHKLMFWKQIKYQEWKTKRQYVKLSDLLDETAGKL